MRLRDGCHLPQPARVKGKEGEKNTDEKQDTLMEFPIDYSRLNVSVLLHNALKDLNIKVYRGGNNFIRLLEVN